MLLVLTRGTFWQKSACFFLWGCAWIWEMTWIEMTEWKMTGGGRKKQKSREKKKKPNLQWSQVDLLLASLCSVSNSLTFYYSYSTNAFRAQNEIKIATAALLQEIAGQACLQNTEYNCSYNKNSLVYLGGYLCCFGLVVGRYSDLWMCRVTTHWDASAELLTTN